MNDPYFSREGPGTKGEKVIADLVPGTETELEICCKKCYSISGKFEINIVTTYYSIAKLRLVRLCIEELIL